MITPHQVRTSLVVSAAAATVLAALALAPRRDSCSAVAPAATTDPLISARLTSTRILAGERDQDIAVTIRAPRESAPLRPPISLGIVIDRSGSMKGPPLDHAKAAAIELVDQLAETDAFTVIAYSYSDESVVPIERATAQNKAAAHDLIARIWADGGTCISCGLARGQTNLAETPIAGGIRRMILISDGQANIGIRDRGRLAELAATTAGNGVSISSLGVGLAFDEVTMMALAEAGHGNYYFVEDTANLDTMFASELGGLIETVATDVRLVVVPQPGVELVETYGYQSAVNPLAARAGIPLADLRAGETRNVVVHVRVTDAHAGPLAIARFELAARRVAGDRALAGAVELVADVVDDPAVVAASIDRTAVQAVEQARAAKMLEQATIAYEHDGAAAAQQIVRDHLTAIRANRQLDATARVAIESASGAALDSFAKAPAAKAMKVSREGAYKLAR